MKNRLASPYFLALDIDDPKLAVDLTLQTAKFVGGFKIGPRLALRGGPEMVKKIAASAPVFLDMKFYDIPSTMEAAVISCAELGAQYITVHASAGPAALKKLAQVEKVLNESGQSVRILAVTILTSFSQQTLPKYLTSIPIERQVKELAKDVLDSGLTGLVCSPHEVSAVRALYPTAFLVTPGIRLPEDAVDDQSRAMSPEEALQQGASALVIGRPILKAADPLARAQSLFETLRCSE